MSDFPKGPLVPEPGSPTFRAPEGDSRSNHPALDNTRPDADQDWDMTPAIAHLVQNTAEREGISAAEAMRQLRAGCDDKGEYAKPRVEDKLGEAGWQTWQSAGE
jgi:hypothetical protein